MRYVVVALAAVLACSSALSAPDMTRPYAKDARIVAGQLLVKPVHARSSKMGARRTVEALSEHAGVPLRYVRDSSLGWIIVDVGEDVDEAKTTSLVDSLRKHALVADTAPVRVWRAFARTPNDEFFGAMWHLESIGARNAWDITQGRTQNLVGVVDTGTVFNHEDLIGKNAAQFDFVSNVGAANDGNGRDADATDPGDNCQGEGNSFHGTHVAGTILANGNNGVGVTGVSWNARLVTGRALGRCGGSNVDINEAILWMAGFDVDGAPVLSSSLRPRVINLSLGGEGACDGFSNDVINAVTARGHIVVVAAGNEGNDVPVASPANCTNAIAVAAYGPRNGISLAPYSNFSSEIAIVAPGGDQRGDFSDGVLSSVDASISPFQGNVPYSFFEGTSMAAPHVAGVISLMLDVNPSLNKQTVLDLIKSNSGTCATCRNRPTLRADLAVAAAAEAAGITPTPPDPPTPSEGEGEGEGEGEQDECDVRRGNMDCANGSGCVVRSGVARCVRDRDGDLKNGELCDDDDECGSGLCDRGVCTVTCDDVGCRDGYSCSRERDSNVPGGICRADSCVDDPTICGSFACSYSSAKRYVCAAGPSNYLLCGAAPMATMPLAFLAIMLRRRRR